MNTLDIKSNRYLFLRVPEERGETMVSDCENGCAYADMVGGECNGCEHPRLNGKGETMHPVDFGIQCYLAGDNYSCPGYKYKPTILFMAPETEEL